MIFEDDFTLTIGGASVAGTTTFDVLNPATQAVIALAPAASREQLDEAVSAARTALAAWSQTPLADRRSAMQALAATIAANRLTTCSLVIEPSLKLLSAAVAKQLHLR